MFAFAIWDTHSKALFLARDAYGIKPLYYSQASQGVVFASQVKAVFASGFGSREREPAGLAGFYLWGSIPEPWTLYRDVYALPAGHYMWVRGGVADKPVQWQDISASWRRERCAVSPQDLQHIVRSSVSDSVRAHLVADVPVSVFLSGGIDSGVIAAVASELGARVTGITVGFEEFNGSHQDEIPAACAIATHYNIPHHVRIVSRAEFERDIPRIFEAMDQPSIDGINTWFASKAVSELGYKVVLSGVGGDELFCGYPSFQRIPRMVAFGNVVRSIPGTRSLLRAGCALLAAGGQKVKLAAMPDYLGSVESAYFLTRCLFLPWELPALMGPELAQEGLARLGDTLQERSGTSDEDDASRVAVLESTRYLRNQLLRDSDWASMGHSLELRTPLVDATLAAALAPFTSSFVKGGGKSLLANSPQTPLPLSVARRRKSGFGIPMAMWISDSSALSEWSRSKKPTSTLTPWARRWAQVVDSRMIAVTR
jgi:asparagine synthase (glutamine-hydrolysing)